MVKCLVNVVQARRKCELSHTTAMRMIVSQRTEPGGMITTTGEAVAMPCASRHCCRIRRMRKQRCMAVWLIAWCTGSFLLAGCAAQTGGERASAPYRGFEADRALMRKTAALPASATGGKPLKASSPEAVGAAMRIFERTPLLFRTRAEILQLLGDPGTISDYNDPATAGEADPLHYRFDTGWNGFQITISFEPDGTVSEIKYDR